MLAERIEEIDWGQVEALRSTGTRFFTVLQFAVLPQIMPRQIGLSMRSEEHTSELQSLMRISYAVFCLKKKQIFVIEVIHVMTCIQSVYMFIIATHIYYSS